MPKLSILVPTLSDRKQYLDRLVSVLDKQLSNDVELLIELDNKQQSIGQKRNKLLDKASGEYISFVDDDDIVSSDYTKLILEAIEQKPDVVGIHLMHYNDGILGGMTYHSLRYKSWYENTDTSSGLKRYYRNPNHINPVKKEIAVAVKFPDISMGEDKDYSRRLLSLLNSEVYIHEPIYHYLFRTSK